MSYYYDYYIGYINKKDGRVYPFGPYIKKGDTYKIKSALSYTRGFNYEISDVFSELPYEMYSDELMAVRDIFSYYESSHCQNPKYCKVSELPTNSFVKSGYALIQDVAEYQKDKDPDVFYNMLDSVVYNGMVEAERKTGKWPSIDDEEDAQYTSGDYMYFSYPDTHSLEYHSFILRQFVESICELEDDGDKEFVIIETEG